MRSGCGWCWRLTYSKEAASFGQLLPVAACFARCQGPKSSSARGRSLFVTSTSKLSWSTFPSCTATPATRCAAYAVSMAYISLPWAHSASSPFLISPPLSRLHLFFLYFPLLHFPFWGFFSRRPGERKSHFYVDVIYILNIASFLTSWTAETPVFVYFYDAAFVTRFI